MSPIKQQLLDAIDQTPDSILEQLFLLLQTLTQPHPSSSKPHPPFGILQGSGEILGDVVNPIVSLSEWEVLQ